MPIDYHDLGDLVRVEATFTDAATDAAIDPTAVKLSYRTPGGTTTTLVYGTDAALVKDGVGEYHVDIDANAAGTWYYRWWSTGTGQAAKEEQFVIREARAV